MPVLKRESVYWSVLYVLDLCECVKIVQIVWMHFPIFIRELCGFFREGFGDVTTVT